MNMSTPSTTFRSDDERARRRSEMARALARGGMESVKVLSLEEADELLTPKRQQLIEALSRDEYESVRGLARALDRDKAQVSRDLGTLAEHGLVTYDTDGRSKSPQLTQDRVVVEPII